MAHIVLYDRLAFQKVKFDDEGNRTIEPDGPEVIVKKGGYVPDFVEDWQLSAYQQSGMITAVADRPAAPEPEPVGPPPPVDGRPKDADSRAKWEAYATSDAVGMTPDEAATPENKAALIQAVDDKLATK